MANLVNAVKPYWPAVVAGLYLAYVAAAGQMADLPQAIAAFLAAAGLNHGTVEAHARVAAAEAKLRLVQQR